MSTRVLFLCTGNFARSQMVEAFVRKYAGERFEAFSAGLEPKGVNQRLHWSFEDPATFEGTNDEKLAKFREIRDKIEQRVLDWLAEQNVLASNM